MRCSARADESPSAPRPPNADSLPSPVGESETGSPLWRARFARNVARSVAIIDAATRVARVSRCTTKRRRPESNRRIAVLQTAALPLGYGAQARVT